MSKAKTIFAMMGGVLTSMTGTAAWLCVANFLTGPAQAADQPREKNIGGYLSIGCSQAPASFNAGYSFYTAAWPLVEKYPGHQFQSGLYGTWMFAQYEGRGPDKLYSDVEVDPALLVIPPKGKEVGYVPIATRQEWGGSATQPRGH